VPLGELKRSHIRALLASKAGLSRNTLKNILVPLRAMLNAAVDEERIPGNPAIRVFKRKRGQTEHEARKVTTLTEEELSRILNAADEHCPDHADVIYVLAWTGLRISEACGLQWGDLDLDAHFLSVNRAVAYRQHRLIVGAPKSGKSRRVDLPEALVARLRARQSISEAGGDSGWP